ncbi:TPA: flagellar basal body-associated protein FliL [Vibrio cholerae]|uniref:Flagellar protein FliL n=1 Tax=Vibrio cholerae TaxID=666 RepID=A0A5C9T448_VIBCL|nr:MULTISPECIES: flagellar basal body-associated protein FliL [Vibrio]MBP8548122.1 flagellar basal body-associated protein FliL [Vibrio paracholerae]MBW5432285.1 flagellar basal body-associated protein FliL [Vibrio cholerae]MCO7020355.1 flagellar basal body-associated protein FliL [Vibrio paracholerae]MCO7030610.1 flagellar basal body-associated protein FliL [Vibrio paracholerae]MCO7067690.1 flagellar basal body-associated protein FliL [Vibrio paracholerae]
MLKRYVVQIMLALSFIIPFHGHAEEKSAVPQLAYFTLEPELTTNFFTKGNKLGYIQVRIDIMVAKASDLPIVEQHQPLIRDAVVELLGKQTEDTIKSLAGREDLRKSLVNRLNNILLPEVGRTVIADLLFTKYIYQ